MTDALAIKRVGAGPGDRVRFADGYLTLAGDEAWLVADAGEAATRAAGFGPPIDSNRFGPVSLRPPRRPGAVPLRPAAPVRARRAGAARDAGGSERSPATGTRPVGRQRDAGTPAGAAVPHDRDDRGRAGARGADPRPAGRARRPGRQAGRRAPRGGRAQPARRRHRLRHERARRARGRGDLAGGVPDRGPAVAARARRHAGRGPGLRRVPRGAPWRLRGSRRRDQPRRRHLGDEPRARARQGVRRDDRPRSPSRTARPGARLADITRRDRRAGPELVPHRRLPLADPRRHGDRGAPHPPRTRRPRRRASCSPPASRPAAVEADGGAWPARSPASTG